MWRPVKKKTAIFSPPCSAAARAYYLSSLLWWTLVGAFLLLNSTVYFLSFLVFLFVFVAALLPFSCFKWKTNSIWYFPQEKIRGIKISVEPFNFEQHWWWWFWLQRHIIDAHCTGVFAFTSCNSISNSLQSTEVHFKYESI